MTTQTKDCRRCGAYFYPYGNQRYCDTCRGKERVEANPLEARSVALRALMAICHSGYDEEQQIRAAELILESTLPLPGDVDEELEGR
jgi:hypothetical protein